MGAEDVAEAADGFVPEWSEETKIIVSSSTAMLRDVGAENKNAIGNALLLGSTPLRLAAYSPPPGGVRGVSPSFWGEGSGPRKGEWLPLDVKDDIVVVP